MINLQELPENENFEFEKEVKAEERRRKKILKLREVVREKAYFIIDFKKK